MAGDTPFTLNGRIFEAVSLDFWATIAHDTRFDERRSLRRRRAHAWLQDRGCSWSFEEVVEQMAGLSRWWNDSWTTRQVTPTSHDVASRLLAACALEADEVAISELSQLLESVALESPPEPAEGAREAIARLSDALPLALICDTGWTGSATLDKLLDRWGLLEMLPVRIYSDQQGVAKPHRRMFFAAAEGLGVPHHRVVHVGDLEQTDIKGAKSLGMAAIRFDGVRTPEDCKSCTMADAAVPSWSALADLLLAGGEEEALPGGVRL